MSNILYAKDFKDMPWQNGGGTTRELYRISHESDPEKFYFRISVAQVHQSTPFSIMPGIDRFLMLLEGKGFVLHFEDKSNVKLATPFDSFEFEGEEKIQCELIDKNCIDFNVMTDRSWGQSTVTLSHLKMNQIKKYQPTSQTFLYLYQSSPKLVVLEPNDKYEIKATENVMVIEVALTKANH
ncbi:MAG: HutD family protein [Bdellovibrionales bacterium]|nr:HutD family protein [Bdellovibrionales bacterium]